MEVKIGREKTSPVFNVEFRHNAENNLSAVSIFKNGKFLISESVVCNDNHQQGYPRNCKEKSVVKALARGISVLRKIDPSIITREQSYQIYNTYRTLGKKPKWPETSLTYRDVRPGNGSLLNVEKEVKKTMSSIYGIKKAKKVAKKVAKVAKKLTKNATTKKTTRKPIKVAASKTSKSRSKKTVQKKVAKKVIKRR